MAHPRKIIRDRIKNRLIGTAPTHATLAEDRVFATMTPVASIDTVLQDEGPLIMVYVRSESKPEYPAMGTGGCWRTLELAVEALCVGTNDVDDKLDDMAEQIEAALDGFTVPEHPSGDFKLTETQIDVTDAFERVLGGVFLTYEFRYWSDHRPDTTAPFLPTEDPTADGEPTGGSEGLPPTTGPTPAITTPTPDPDSNFDVDAFVHGTEVGP